MAGKALTPDIPRWFNYCYRAMAIPADPVVNQKGEHRIYLDDHVERSSPGTKGLGNSRLPLDSYGPGMEELPSFLTPASLVAAVQLWGKESEKAEKAASARIAAAMKG
jgi:hypothetical protein